MILLSAVAVPTLTTYSKQSVFNWKKTCNDEIGQREDHKTNTETYEALIFLLNTELMLLYEFYPANSRLKTLPNLNLKYSINQINALYIHGKIYITGGISDKNKMAIEEYDAENNYWSVFMHYINGQNENCVLAYDNTSLDLKSSIFFFKLKMFIS